VLGRHSANPSLVGPPDSGEHWPAGFKGCLISDNLVKLAKKSA